MLNNPLTQVVTWDNKPVWSFCAQPFSIYLSHHDLEPMPNGNVLVLCWTRRKDAVSLGRRPDLMPDGEVWVREPNQDVAQSRTR